MDATGAPADANACVCVSIAMFPSEGDCSGELQAIYDQIFDMAEGDKIIEEKGQDMYLHGKPSLRVVDGVLQLTVAFTIDPLVDMLSLDSSYLKTVETHQIKLLALRLEYLIY